MKIKLPHFVLFFLLLLCSVRLFSQEKGDTTITSNLFDLSLEDLMNVEIVSAVKQRQHIADAPSVVSVITEKQIKERGYLSIDEALQSIAGLDIITDHYQPNMGIRGINGGLRSWSRLLKVMIDGQPVSFRSNSDNYIDASLIPMQVIEKIEIVRGPNSALYGKNAFLGVINIITKSGSSLQEASISHYIASINQNTSLGISTAWGGKKNNFDFMFASSYAQVDKSGLSPHNVPGRTIYDQFDVAKYNQSNPLTVFAKLTYEKENIGKIILDANQQIIDAHAEFLDWGTLTHNNRISLFNSYERIRYENVFFDDFNTQLSFTHSAGKPLKHDILDTDSDPGEWIEREVAYTSYDLGGNISYFFDDYNNVLVGIDYISDIHDHQKYYTVNSTGLRTLNPGGTEGIKNFNNLGIYLQMILNVSRLFNINFLNDLTLTAGYRFDYHNIYGDVLTYRLAAVYRLTEKLSTKLMYGTSFNAPSPVQLYTNYIYPGGIVGNPDLQPEKAKTVECAVMGKIIKNVTFSTNLFYTKIDDKIEYLLPYGQTTNMMAENVSIIYSAGIETELNATFYNNTAYVNYSYQKSILEKTDPVLEKIRVNTPLYPNHMIKFGDIYYLNEFFLDINLEGKYISSRIASDQNNFIYDPIHYATERYTLDPYFLMDLTISSTKLKIFEEGATKISLKIENLLDTKHYYPGFHNYDIPGIGRTFYVRFTQYI